MTKFSTWNQVFDICKIKELKQFLTLKLAVNWSPFKYFACHVWTLVILGVKGFHWGYLPPSLPSFKRNILLGFKNTSSVKTYLVQNVAEISSLWRSFKFPLTLLDLPSTFLSLSQHKTCKTSWWEEEPQLIYLHFRKRKKKMLWKRKKLNFILACGWMKTFCKCFAQKSFLWQRRSRRCWLCIFAALSRQRQKEITSSTLHFLPPLPLWVSGKFSESQNYILIYFLQLFDRKCLHAIRHCDKWKWTLSWLICMSSFS